MCMAHMCLYTNETYKGGDVIHICHMCMTYTCGYTHDTHAGDNVRPTQSIMYVPLQVYRFQKFILLFVQYNIQNPVPEIWFSRIWSSAQDYAVQCLLLNPVVFLISASQQSVKRKWFVLAVYQVWKGISAGPSLKYFTWFIGAGGITHIHICHG